MNMSCLTSVDFLFLMAAICMIKQASARPDLVAFELEYEKEEAKQRIETLRLTYNHVMILLHEAATAGTNNGKNAFQVWVYVHATQPCCFPPTARKFKHEKRI
jgi:hypothetical protein